MSTPARLILAAFCIVALAAVAGWSGATAAALATALLGAGAVAVLALGGEAEGPAEIAPPAPPPPGSGVEAAVDAIDDPLLIVAGRTVVQANPAARALLGRHIVGEDARVAIRHPEAASRLAAPPARVRGVMLAGLAGRDSRWELEITPLDEDRRLVRLVDRSETFAAEAMRVDFVANASHELRTPLATLLGFIETLADREAEPDPATQRRFLSIMLGEARRMRQLIDDLLSLSRIEAERHRVPDTPLDLADLARSVADTMRTAAGEPAGTFRVEAAPSLPAVAGDEAQLSQLLHNLLGNALKYRRPGSPVRVGLAPAAAGQVMLTITDEGDGIAAEHLPRLTERFYRVDAGRSRTLGGTGLGLAIVKHIVERHRGRLDIASEVGVGTTVSVQLPAAAS